MASANEQRALFGREADQTMRIGDEQPVSLRCARPRVLWVGLLASLQLAIAAGQASAQYDAPPPPAYDYGVPPPPPGYGYGRPYPPPYALGGRCRAVLPTAYGPRREICPLDHPRPRGEPCRCPPPPGYPPGPWPAGHVIP